MGELGSKRASAATVVRCSVDVKMVPGQSAAFAAGGCTRLSALAPRWLSGKWGPADVNPLDELQMFLALGRRHGRGTKSTNRTHQSIAVGSVNEAGQIGSRRHG